MKRLILISLLLFLYICSYSQLLRWNYNPIYDSLYLTDSDTLETVSFENRKEKLTYVYGINYGDIDSTTVQLYIQGSISSFGWVTIGDTVTLDSNSTERVYYITGTTIPYPDIKFMMRRDTVEDVIDGWIKTGVYIKQD